MRPLLVKALVLVAVLLGATGAANASLLITIDKMSQRMTVSVGGVQKYVWPVSTGALGYATPSGSYTPFRMERDYFSKEWDDAPMPHAIFFTSRGHAIHGTLSTRRLGRRASHGCVRLAPENAAMLFALVKREGMGSTRIVVSGGFDLGNMPIRLPAFKKAEKADKVAKTENAAKFELAPGLKKLFQIR